MSFVVGTFHAVRIGTESAFAHESWTRYTPLSRHEAEMAEARRRIAALTETSKAAIQQKLNAVVERNAARDNAEAEELLTTEAMRRVAALEDERDAANDKLYAAQKSLADVEKERDEAKRLLGLHVASTHSSFESEVQERVDMLVAERDRERDAARAEAARLREALLKYGRHPDGCITRYATTRSRRPCDCGLDAALAPATPTKEGNT